MELVKKHNQNNTISVTIVDNGAKKQTIKDISIGGSRGLLVVTMAEGVTYQESNSVYREINRLLQSKQNPLTIIVPSNIQIDYIKF